MATGAGAAAASAQLPPLLPAAYRGGASASLTAPGGAPCLANSSNAPTLASASAALASAAAALSSAALALAAAVPATTAVWWAIAASTLVAEPMVHVLSSSALASLRLPATAAVAGSLSRATGAALG